MFSLQTYGKKQEISEFVNKRWQLGNRDDTKYGEIDQQIQTKIRLKLTNKT